MNVARCACGAIGRTVAPPPARSSQRAPVLMWTGGRIGAARMAVEPARTDPGACPACQHRACVFQALSDPTASYAL